jgi:uncharacterized protein (DUF433 family)
MGKVYRPPGPTAKAIPTPAALGYDARIPGQPPQGRRAMKKTVEVGQHLVVDPRTCHGKLTFKGTRVPVQTILTFLSMGYDIKYILRSWPQLSREAVVEAIQMAAVALNEKFGAKPTQTYEPTHSGRSAGQSPVVAPAAKVDNVPDSPRPAPRRARARRTGS